METQAQAPEEMAGLAAPVEEAVPVETVEIPTVSCLSSELTHELAGELVRKLGEIEAAKPELIGKLRAERENVEKTLDAEITRLKTEASTKIAGLTKALHALGWRRPRAKSEGAPAVAKAPAKKRGRKPKAKAATQPAGEVAPAGTEN